MMSNRQEEIMDLAISYVKGYLDNESSGHDSEHVFRVYRTAMDLAKKYDANLFVVGLTALLHDLDDPKISEVGSHRASDFLKKYNIEEYDWILGIIQSMSFSSHKEGKKVSTLEGEIVQDADRLDALGAIGISRCFAYSGFKNRPLYKGDKDDNSAIAHFYQKLFLLPELMNTEEARIIAKKRVEFMKEYLNEFYREWTVKS